MRNALSIAQNASNQQAKRRGEQEMITILYLMGAIALFLDLITRDLPEKYTLCQHVSVALLCAAIWPAFILAKIFSRI